MFGSARCTRIDACPIAEQCWCLTTCIALAAAAALVVRRLSEGLRVWRIGRPECVEPIAECAAARRKRVDLTLLQKYGLTEFLQRALEVGEFDLNCLDSCGIIHSEIISA